MSTACTLRVAISNLPVSLVRSGLLLYQQERSGDGTCVYP